MFHGFLTRTPITEDYTNDETNDADSHGHSLADGESPAHANGKLEAHVTGGESVRDVTVAPNTTIPVTGLVTGALGKADFRLMPGGSLNYTLKVSVMPATEIFMAHIHLGPKGEMDRSCSGCLATLPPVRCRFLFQKRWSFHG